MKRAPKRYPSFSATMESNPQKLSFFKYLLENEKIELIDKHFLSQYILFHRPDVQAEQDNEEFLDKLEAELATPNF